jgi:tRNA nucleotidyltransferase (CCA-adding enzyme)
VLAQPELIDRLRALPGMERVLPALQGPEPCFLVGGAVRDLMLGETSVDVDVAVEGHAEAVALRLAAALDGEVRAHERFGTATVEAGGLQVDLATTRRESYSAPGALPDVEPATLVEDLGRRDFTINAMALALTGDDLGTLHDPHRGREDVVVGQVRVLHDASFVDDPTRLLRAVRYAARFGFVLETTTERLAREAVVGDALTTVSGPRVRDELMDLLAEQEAPRALELSRALELDVALHSALRADPELVASARLGALETGADPALTSLAVLCVDAPDELEEWVDRLGLAAASRDTALRAARRAPALVGELDGELRPSEVYGLLRPEPPEALALALALRAPARPVLDFVSRLSAIRLDISGDDLRAAGVPQSPALGMALERTLARKLDGELDGREAELEAALAIAREQA